MAIDKLEALKVLRDMFDAGCNFGWEEAKCDEHGLDQTQTLEEAFKDALTALAGK